MMASSEQIRSVRFTDETYGKAGNLLSRAKSALIQTFSSDKLNQLPNITRNTSLTVAGLFSAAGSNATINGQSAAIYGDWTFASTAGVSLSDGSNTFTISAKTWQGQTNMQVTSANLPTSISLLFDSNGNLTNDGLRNFEYDAMDRLAAVTVSNAWRSEFMYDGLSRMRIRKEKTWQGTWTLTNEVRYVCLGRLVFQERDGSNVPKVNYTRGLDLSGSWGGAGGIGGLLARNDINGTAFYHADAMGNVTALVNPQGQIKARYVYDPFGNLVTKSGSLADANLYRFSSKELHPNSGMYYYGFRFYEPTMQRWMNKDPLGLRGGLNLYGFVGNNPGNGVDTYGGEVLHYGVTPSGEPTVIAPDVNLTPEGATSVGLLAASMAPMVGEAMDASVLSDPDAAWWEKALVAGSLLANTATDGFLPNAGAFLKARKLCRERTPAETKKARNFFKNHKDEAKRAWEERTGKEWPKDGNGNDWPSHHPDSLKSGGDPMQVEPQNPKGPDPHNVPGPDGKTDYQRWGAQGTPAREANKKQ